MTALALVLLTAVIGQVRPPGWIDPGAPAPPATAPAGRGVGQPPPPGPAAQPHAAPPVRYRDVTTGDRFHPVVVSNWHGYMNHRGDLIVWPQFDWAEEAYDDMLRVVKDGRTGFLNSYGLWSIEPQYVWADRFSDNLALVQLPRASPHSGMGHGYIDKRGRVAIAPAFDQALRFSDGAAAVMVGDRCGYIDKRGQWLVQPQFVRARSYHEGFAAVRLPPPAPPAGQAAAATAPAKDGPWAFLDRGGRPAWIDRSGELEEVGDFRENLVRVKANGKWGYIDRTFRAAIAPQFDEARDFHDNLAAVRRDARWGYIDRRGQWVIPAHLEEARDFENRLAVAKLEGKFGYLDRSGGWRLRPQYAQADPFREDRARVLTSAGVGYIDVAGNLVWTPGRPEYILWSRSSTAEFSSVANPRPTSGARMEPPPERLAAPPRYEPDWRYRDEDFLPKPRKP